MFQIQVGDENVQPGIAIDIRGVYSHTGLGLAVIAHSNAGHQCYFTECSIAVVAEEEVRITVVRNEDVLPPIVVEIECNNAQAATRAETDFGSLSHVRESPVPIMPIEGRLLTFKLIRVTVTSITRLILTAPDVIIRRPVHEIGNREVQPPVIVCIEPCGARSPLPSIGNTRMVRDIRKCSIPVVVVKNRAIVSQYE